MPQMLFCLLLCLLVWGSSQAQPFQNSLLGQWEDDASTSSDSYQMVYKKGQLAFVRVPQANLLDPVPLTREVLHQYTWLTDSVLRYSKLPEPDPMRAKFNPRRHHLMRIDSMSGDLLYLTISDEDWSKKELDSIVGNPAPWYRAYFTNKRIRYRRLNLAKQKNRAKLLGLWEDNRSDDSTSFQFYVERGQFGFNKIKKNAPAELTAIKPNAGYDYFWITENIVCYRRQPQTGLVANASKNPNVYVLMRIEKLTRSVLEVTLSSRPFDAAGLEYIKAENQLDLYFHDEQLSYKRIPIVDQLVSEAP